MNTTSITTTHPFDLTDEQLMVQIQQREAESLEYLYDRYSPILKSVIMKTVHNEAEADDLLQEIFMEVWNRAASYDPSKGRPLGWLVTLSRRRAIDRLRKMQAYARAGERFQTEKERHPESWSTDPEEDFFTADTRTMLQGILATLPPAQKEAIEFAYYKGMSQREIAVHTHIPLGTIKTRLELGLKKMSSALLAYAGEF